MTMKYNKALPVLCLLTLASCGGNGGGNKNAAPGLNHPLKPENGPRQEMQATEGVYKAILRPFNYHVSGWVPYGMADIRIDGDEVDFKSWLDDSADIKHMQNIHVGTRCPGPEDDTNKDGYVDFNEAVAASGKVIMPLDGDLNSQGAGSNQFPVGDFDYAEKASLSAMMQDLQLDDFNSNDTMVKLGGDEGLNLAGKVIIILGSSPKNRPDLGPRTVGQSNSRSTPLPKTISLVNGQSADVSIPIACGVIERK